MKWYWYVLLVLLFIISSINLYLLFTQHTVTIINNNVIRDSIYIEYRDTIKEITKQYYVKETELHIDTFRVNFADDTTLYQNILSKSRTILNKGFIDIDIQGFEGGGISNRPIELSSDTAYSVRSVNRFSKKITTDRENNY